LKLNSVLSIWCVLSRIPCRSPRRPAFSYAGKWISGTPNSSNGNNVNERTRPRFTRGRVLHSTVASQLSFILAHEDVRERVGLRVARGEGLYFKAPLEKRQN